MTGLLRPKIVGNLGIFLGTILVGNRHTYEQFIFPRRLEPNRVYILVKYTTIMK